MYLCAITNEVGIDSQFTNNIVIRDDHSTVDLPEGMPDSILKTLKKMLVTGKAIDLEEVKVEFDGGSDKPRLNFRGAPRQDAVVKQLLNLVSLDVETLVFFQE